MGTVINEKYMVCVDCALFIAYGETSNNDAQDLRMENAINAVGGVVCNGEKEQDIEWSSIPCDCCGSTLYGPRSHCVIFSL